MFVKRGVTDAVDTGFAVACSVGVLVALGVPCIAAVVSLVLSTKSVLLITCGWNDVSSEL